MKDISKPIRLAEHAKEKLSIRGANEAEIKEAIRTTQWKPAELGRLECRKEFAFKKIWNEKFYEYRTVRPIFVEEKDRIFVITVYVYYY
ncbi:MAG: hypothetical protein KJ706_06575 [Candidatus Omnitrophica bacterium]|nr:hypothetical protein [Candidatus Omnitrophota bacterium]MBU4457410.1 hypothetical protein [Candidatus Omnitrophota bacterium]